MPKITPAEHVEVEALFPEHMAGKLTIRARGETFVKLVTVPKGEPANFLTEAELRAKYHGLADAVLGPDRTRLLADAVLALGAPLLAARLAGE